MSTPIVISSGFRIPSQIRMESKLYFEDFDSLKDSGPGNLRTFEYYEDMVVFCAEGEEFYIWKENVRGLDGVLEQDHIYPSGLINNGINYSLRSFNFFKIEWGIIYIEGNPFTYKPHINTNIYDRVITVEDLALEGWISEDIYWKRAEYKGSGNVELASSWDPLESIENIDLP